MGTERIMDETARQDIAVNCCFCGRDLTDALSQERGYGPICAAKYGMLFDTTDDFADDLDERMADAVEYTTEDRRHVAVNAKDCYREDKKLAAKRLAYLLSYVTGISETAAQLLALEGLGFRALAGIIAAERGSSAVTHVTKKKAEMGVYDTRFGQRLFLRTPVKPKGTSWDEMVGITGRRWDRDARCNSFPLYQWDDLVAWVKRYYPLSDVPEKPAEVEADKAKARTPEPTAVKEEVVRLSLLSKRIAIESPYNQGFVNEVRALPNRKWMCLECGAAAKPKCETHPDGQHVWTVPLDQAEHIKRMIKQYFPKAKHVVSRALAEALDQQDKKIRLAHSKLSPVMDLPGGQLYPFQGAGVIYLEASDGRAILADEQGLGKTVQAIAYAKRNIRFEQGETVLYVVPANVKFNWASEIAHWLGGAKLNDSKILRQLRRTGYISINGVEISVISGKPSKGMGRPVAQHVVINYDLLSAWEDLLKAANYTMVVADEAQNLKNQKAARTKSFEHIAKKIDRRVLLTGTPVLNRPKDLWNLLKIVDPLTWGNYFQFHQRYTNAKHNGFGWDFSGAANMTELHERLDGHQWIRRLKKDVLTELPEKIRHIVPLEISDSDRRAYERVERDCADILPRADGKLLSVKDMDTESRDVVLAQITRLRKAAALAKIKAAGDWIEDLVESVGKVVVFAHHQKVVEALVERFDALRIDGGTAAGARTQAVQDFQNDPSQRVIVCSIKAASAGITLTAASHVVLVERVWRAKDHSQAEDRIHRIGQTEQATAWYLDADDTFDVAMRAVNDWKDSVADAIVDGTEVGETQGALQMALDYFSEKAADQAVS